MAPESVLDISQQAVKVALMLAAPMLLGAMLVGITISIFQAITQINEQTLTFVPKIVAIFLLLVISSPWLIETMQNFTIDLFTGIPQMVVAK